MLFFVPLVLLIFVILQIIFILICQYLARRNYLQWMQYKEESQKEWVERCEQFLTERDKIHQEWYNLMAYRNRNNQTNKELS